MLNKELSSQVAGILGVQGMSADQQEAFFTKAGDVLIESSLNVLLSTLTEEDMDVVNEKLESASDQEDILSYLIDTFPQFEKIIEEQITALQKETVEVIK